MTPSPTEQEIVARAINDVLPVRFQRGDAQKEHQLADCIPFAQAAISALDQYRAKNAGEVERECAEIIDRNKMYMDGFDGKNELVVGPLNLRWRVEEATDQLSKAANLISSMRSVIEEKDRALKSLMPGDATLEDILWGDQPDSAGAKPVRLQLSRKRGFNLQELSRTTNGLEAVNVARPGKYGNPFTISFCESWFGISENGARLQAIELHKQWIDGTLEPGWTDKIPPTKAEVRADIQGKNVACFCGTDDACHGDTLLEIANSPALEYPENAKAI